MDQQREHRIDNANKGWETLYNKTISIETDSLNNRLAMIEKKENNIMKQYEMNEEIIRNLKSNMNTELNVSLTHFLTFIILINFVIFCSTYKENLS